MDRQELLNSLTELNAELMSQNVYGEIAIVGGAVMCLVYNARQSTNDIDAIFDPAFEMRIAALNVARKLGLPPDWLNDGAKGYMSEKGDLILFEKLSNLSISVANGEYMFAMKAISCRTENENEMKDLRFLIEELNILSVEQATDIIRKYYPLNRVLPKTQYVLEELIMELS